MCVSKDSLSVYVCVLYAFMCLCACVCIVFVHICARECGNHRLTLGVFFNCFSPDAHK